MKFRDGSLLYHHGTGKMYLVSTKKLRRIQSPFVMDQLNLKFKDAVWVTDEEIQLHETGAPLT